MSELVGDERSLSEPFWMIDDVAEGRIVNQVLRRRFPEAFEILSSSLDKADPLDVVYPGSPSEYSDVVREVLVLLAAENCDLVTIDRDRLAAVVKEALARCFGEEADDARTSRAVDLIHRRAMR